jgi:hypothetical protein
MTAGAAALESLAGRVRARVAERRYREAQDAMAEYCRALRREVAGRAPGDPARQRLKHEWQGLLEEIRRRLLADRAHAGLRLARLPKPPRPYGDGPQPRRTWLYLA